MCNAKLYPASVLDLVLACHPAPMAALCRPVGWLNFDASHFRQKKKKRINRCIRHARNFCVWINRHIFVWSRTASRMTFPIATRFAPGHVIHNPARRYFSAGIVIALFARFPMANTTETIARYGQRDRWVLFIHGRGGSGSGQNIPENAPNG